MNTTFAERKSIKIGDKVFICIDNGQIKISTVLGLTNTHIIVAEGNFRKLDGIMTDGHSLEIHINSLHNRERYSAQVRSKLGGGVL